jgi:hypothetical protein
MKQPIIFVIILFVSVNFAQNSDYQNARCSYDLIEQNYLGGLNSENCGLRVSCAYFLGEMKSQKAVIPLMNLLNTCKTDEVRLIAALSLIKIGDKRGIYIVKRQAEFCDSERVRLMCGRFYNSFTMQKYTDLKDYVLEGDDEFKVTISSFER